MRIAATAVSLALFRCELVASSTSHHPPAFPSPSTVPTLSSQEISLHLESCIKSLDQKRSISFLSRNDSGSEVVVMVLPAHIAFGGRPESQPIQTIPVQCKLSNTPGTKPQQCRYI